MKKIHIGSKINLVEAPEEPRYPGENSLIEPGQHSAVVKNYNRALQYAIDNPIAEFDGASTSKILDIITHGSGLHDIPEGYRVEVKEEPIYHELAADYLGFDIDGEPIPRIKRTFVNIASLVPIKEEKPLNFEIVRAIADEVDPVSAYKEELIEYLKKILPDLGTQQYQDGFHDAIEVVIDRLSI